MRSGADASLSRPLAGNENNYADSLPRSLCGRKVGRGAQKRQTTRHVGAEGGNSTPREFDVHGQTAEVAQGSST